MSEPYLPSKAECSVGMIKTFMKELKVKLFIWSFITSGLFKKDGLNLNQIRPCINIFVFIKADF